MCLPAAASPAAQGPSSTPSQLLVFVGGKSLGSEESTLQRTAEGWVVSGSGRLAPPLDLTTRRITVRYDASWKPLELTVDALSRGSPFSIHTVFDGTNARNDVIQLGQPTKKVDAVSPDTVVLPNLFFSSYEALAARLAAMPGESATLPAYIAPQAEIRVTASRLDTQTIETTRGTVTAHRYSLTFDNPGSPLPAELWTDDGGRLLRLEVAAQGLVVIRDDIGAVTARRQNITRAGDESVRIAANGFNLIGTLSKPSGPGDEKGRYPAVILVAGADPHDRDETIAGIPLFGEIAGGLADQGFRVLRYDKRGVGQSGGRADGASLADYADDVLAAVKFLRDRKDVGDDRIAVMGYSEGALVALLAASREKHIKALVLAAAPSGTGGELVLEQQQHVLEKLSLPPAEKGARVALQKKIQAAVLGEGDWKDVPVDLRRQADTEWFRSFLAFSAASVMDDVKQPILILHGERDTEIVPSHAEKLAAIARARKKMPADSVKVVMLPELNHIFVPAKTGETSEYASLAEKKVSPEVANAAAAFLKEKLSK